MSGQLFQRLAHVDNAAGASAALISPVFDVYDFLLVHVRISGYSAAAVARLQFNGDAGTTAYAYSVQEFTGAATPVATGGSAVAAAAAGINCAVTTGVARALITFWIRNVNGQVHGINWTGSTNSEAAATAPATVIGSGIWTTTSQITRITLDVGSGGGTLSAGTAMDIFGCL